jgi:ribonuclease VapC
MISIIAGDDDADRLADLLDEHEERLCSALSVWETIAGLRRSYALSVPAARERATVFVAFLRLKFVPIGERECELAADALARYGKGRHPAQLNMGDCFAYACAKAHGARLLYKGQDFTQTDLA